MSKHRAPSPSPLLYKLFSVAEKIKRMLDTNPPRFRREPAFTSIQKPIYLRLIEEIRAEVPDTDFSIELIECNQTGIAIQIAHGVYHFRAELVFPPAPRFQLAAGW